MDQSDQHDYDDYDDYANEIAVVGMVGRFPGAPDIETFWQNLCNGIESITFFSNQELEAAGVPPALVNDPRYVKANGVLEGVEWFDASFFGIFPHEAEIIDPQQRLFLECAWEALENAGYDPERYKGSIGVLAGCAMNTYLLDNLFTSHNLAESAGQDLDYVLGNDECFLSTRVSYKLNLTGPSVNVQTACSTSLVSTHMACQSLLNGECDMVLAGGIAIHFPQKGGYFYTEGSILTPDGHCRPFDAKAQGTIFGDGVGIVVLKRLKDALADGDYIHAVIKGSAINNDGALKGGLTAPSIVGQTKVIAEALSITQIDPATISYVETHGTGTVLGDPIEVASLTKAFSAHTDKKQFCAIGSVKSNIGHLDRASGVASLIKTILSLEHKMLPPTLHFQSPNPKIDFLNSPFYVNAALTEWKASQTPRRAGVNSLGMGGTNVHMILEEAPTLPPSRESRAWQLLVLSAKTDAALETASANLAQHLRQHPELNLADAAFTLQMGRKAMDYRRALVCRDKDDAIAVLENKHPERRLTGFQGHAERPVAFMFSGQGAQYVNMALELYQAEPTFRKNIVRCSELLHPHLGLDLRRVLYPEQAQAETAAQQLVQTAITQPALFVVEYALAQLWMEWGVQPQAMIGHSIGEYVAACLAGVFSLQDALALVAARGQLMQSMPGGAMLSVPLPEDQVQPLLSQALSLAAVNAPALCVVSGSTEDVEALAQRLTEMGVNSRQLYTSHAFHSQMMDAILEPFVQRVKQVKLHPPQMAYLSNVTGDWITAEQATDPRYWATHLRQTVRFAAGLAQLIEEPTRVLLEVGPGRTLSTFARQAIPAGGDQVISTSLRHPQDRVSDVAFLLDALGRLWLAGAPADWEGFYSHEQRRRVPLPPYPFQRQRYWIERQARSQQSKETRSSPNQRLDIADWFYIPSWKRKELVPGEHSKSRWLVFVDEAGLGARLVERLERQGWDVVTVAVGDRFSQLSGQAYTLRPDCAADYDALLSQLISLDRIPDKIVHLGSLMPASSLSDQEQFGALHSRGFGSLLLLAQALGKQGVTASIQINWLTNQGQDVSGQECVRPAQAAALGLCKVIPQEYPHLTCRSIDIVLPSDAPQWASLASQLEAECAAPAAGEVVAYRGGRRWTQVFEPVRLNGAAGKTARLREGGVYLITSGLEGVGQVLADYLARKVKARLVLVESGAFPKREEWDRWLAAHDAQDKVSAKIRLVQALEEHGAQALVISAQATDAEQMRRVIESVYQQYGALHGVLHTSGMPGETMFRAIQETDVAASASFVASRAQELAALERALPGDLDFCILQSSLSSVLGGLGFATMAAADSLTDAFAHEHNRTRPLLWGSINWDAWQSGEEQGTTKWNEGAITVTEGSEAFERILNAGITPVLISTSDLPTRLTLVSKPAGIPTAALSEGAQAGSRHQRPNLPTPYVAPQTELEDAIARIWQELLGIDQVGIYDNFFEIGGHSLLAMKVTARLRDTFPVELSVGNLFLETPTVNRLAVLIEDKLLEKLEGLSDEQAQSL